MKKSILCGGICALGAAIAIAGCTDMTTQQYHDQEVQDQLAQDNAIAGTYNGSLTALTDGSAIGAVQIKIDSGAQPIPSQDGTTTDSQAVITGSVKIIGATSSEASFTGGYAPDTGVVTGTISIQDEGLTLKLSGKVSGSHFSGTIQSDQFPGDGGRFDADLNGSLPPAQGSSSGQVPSHLFSYSGSGAGPDCALNGDTCGVSMTIDDNPATSADAFADSVVNVSNVVIQLFVDIGPGPTGDVVIPYTFGGPALGAGTAQLDKRNGNLTGKSPAGTGVASLNCSAIGAPAQNNPGWSCRLGNLRFKVTPSAAAQ